MSGLSSLVSLPSTSAGSSEKRGHAYSKPQSLFNTVISLQIFMKGRGGSVLGLKDIGMLRVVLIPVTQTSINSAVLPPPPATLAEFPRIPPFAFLASLAAKQREGLCLEQISLGFSSNTKPRPVCPQIPGLEALGLTFAVVYGGHQ